MGWWIFDWVLLGWKWVWYDAEGGRRKVGAGWIWLVMGDWSGDPLDREERSEPECID